MMRSSYIGTVEMALIKSSGLRLLYVYFVVYSAPATGQPFLDCSLICLHIYLKNHMHPFGISRYKINHLIMIHVSNMH